MSIQKQVGLVPSEGLVAKNHSSITQFDAVAGLSAAEKQELSSTGCLLARHARPKMATVNMLRDATKSATQPL